MLPQNLLFYVGCHQPLFIDESEIEINFNWFDLQFGNELNSHNNTLRYANKTKLAFVGLAGQFDILCARSRMVQLHVDLLDELRHYFRIDDQISV